MNENVEVPNKDLNELNPKFREKVELFLKEVWDKIRVTEGYRSQKRQSWLYDQGRNRKGKIVTWTRKSKHIQRIAIDICFRWRDPYPRDINKWREIAKVAKKYEIDWLYDLYGKDMPHFQDNGKDLKLMGEFEALFSNGENKWNTGLNDLDWFITKTGFTREQVFAMLILINRQINKNK